MSLIEEYLLTRGVRVQTALDHGFELDTSPSKSLITQRLKGDLYFNGQPVSQAAKEILWIPIKGSTGVVDAWIARPLPSAGGKQRFLCPHKVTIAACVFQSAWDSLNHIDVPIVITEGAPKGLAVLQAGGLPIALTGVWMGASCNGANGNGANSNGDSRYDLAHPLDKFAWASRKVLLAFDADQTRNPLVVQALLRLTLLLQAKGAEVLNLSWPLAEGKGIDDYLAGKAGTDTDKQKGVFAGLVANAVSVIDTMPSSWLPLIEVELRKVELSVAARSQLCKRLAKPLGVKVSSLELTVGARDEGEDPNIAARLLEDIEPWPEPVNGLKLVEDLCIAVDALIVIEPQFVLPFVLWAILTYVHQLFNFCPFLRFRSPEPLCGKSTALDTLYELTPRPLMVGTMSASSLFRLIPDYHPAVLLDEAQYYVKKDSDIGGVLDGGYQKGRLAIRTNPNTMEVEFFDTFGPKAIASIGPLADTIESRSIIIPMTRKNADQNVKQICDILQDFPDWFLILRRRVKRWTDDNTDRILATRLRRPAFLGNRLWDKWRPLFTIAHVLGEELPGRVLADAYTIVTGDDSGLSIKTEILSMLRELFREREPSLPDDFKFMFTDELLEHLNSNEEASWADWKTGDKTGLTATKLSKYLKDFKIKSAQPRYGGKRIRGYWIKDFEKSFNTYLPADTPPDPPPPETGGPSGSPEPDEPCPATPTKPSEGNATEDKKDPETAETHFTEAQGAFLGVQPEPQVVTSSGSTIKPARVGFVNPSQAVEVARVGDDYPSRFNRSAATTSEVWLGLEGQKVPSRPCEVFFEASTVFGWIEALPVDLAKIALDIETFMPGGLARPSRKGDPKKGTALDWQAARIRLISLTVTDREPVIIDLGLDPDPEAPIRRAVAALLARLQRVEIVGHRFGFDLCFLEHEFGWRPTMVWDTWIAEELLLNDDWELCDKRLRPKKTVPGPASLENALKRRCDITLDKGLGGGALSDFGADPLLDEQYVYSDRDTRHLFALEAAQRLEVVVVGMERIAEIEMSLVPIMSHMEIVGIPLRSDILIKELADLEGRVTQLDAEILPAMQAVGFDHRLEYSKKAGNYLQPSKKTKPVNLNGDNLKQHYFRGLEKRLRLNMPRTESGLISITLDSLRDLKDPVAKLYFKRGECTALVGGIKQRLPFIGPDGRVHPTHDQLSANTGRISTSEPPMSNLPKVIKGSPLRRGVEAPAGYVIVQGDLGLIEVRAQAHFTGDPLMIELFNLPSGDPRGDIYRLFASWANQCDILDIPDKGEKRNQAKPPVLGTAYLMGLERFIEYARGYGVELTPPRAAELRALYLKKFSGIKAWQDRAWVNAKANKVTEGRSHLGRRRLVLQIPRDASHQYRQAQAQVNYIIQSACADGLKIAIALIVAALPEGAELILTIHDELLVLCRKEQAQEVGKILVEKVVIGYQEALGEPLKVPIVFEVNPLQNWSEK